MIVAASRAREGRLRGDSRWPPLAALGRARLARAPGWALQGGQGPWEPAGTGARRTEGRGESPGAPGDRATHTIRQSQFFRPATKREFAPPQSRRENHPSLKRSKPRKSRRGMSDRMSLVSVTCQGDRRRTWDTWLQGTPPAREHCHTTQVNVTTEAWGRKGVCKVDSPISIHCNHH